MTTERRLVPTLTRTTAAQFHAIVPGSKSETVRALWLAACRTGRTAIDGAADGDDALATARALAAFAGLSVATTPTGLVVERTAARLCAPAHALDLGHGATPARLLLAFAALADGATTITGSAQLRARPMRDGIASLRALGLECSELDGEGHLPVRVFGGVPNGTRYLVRSDASSQFATALVLLASQQTAHALVTVELEGEIASRPYLDTTLAVLRRCGIDANWRGERTIDVVPRVPTTDRVAIEPDASSAGYFLALAALTRCEVVVSGLDRNSVQADLALVRVLRAMGCEVADDGGELRARGRELRGVEADFGAMPDAALTVAALACAASGPSTLRGLRTLRHKESDRIRSASAALEALGAVVESGDDWLRVTPPARLRAAVVDANDDHRVAMAFALLGTVQEGIEIDGAECVTKSFPGFFDELERFVAVHRGS